MKAEQLQMDLPEVNQEPQRIQPSNEEVIDLLSRKVIQQEAEIKELKQLNSKMDEELTEAKIKIKNKIEVNRGLRDELDRVLKKLDELQTPCKCEGEINPYQGYYTPWENKVKELYEHLLGERYFYEEEIRQLKHKLIEVPRNKAIIKKEIKFNKAHLKTIKAIMRKVVK
jgi:chromosome segregation ATPase